MLVPEELLPGDVLLYGPRLGDIWALLICIKTWTMLSHTEVYCGRGRVVAARSEGVDIYSNRIDQYLRYVRRPETNGRQFDLEGASAAVRDMLGKPYEVSGLLSFYRPWHQRHHATRICSSVVTLFLRGGGCEPFNPEVDEHEVSPAQLWQTPHLSTIWDRDQDN